MHLKTAGTTWLEELLGIAESSAEGCEMAKEIYFAALARTNELCSPYGAVIEINPAELPSRAQVRQWSSSRFVAAIEHDRRNPDYSPQMRQLLHVAYKVAAEMRSDYLGALQKYRSVIGRRVTANLYEKHIKAVFPRD